MQKTALLIFLLLPRFLFSQLIWSDDFSNPNTWIIEHDENTCNLDWQIGNNLTNQGDFAIDNIYSTTSSNGFAMLDSDYYGQENGGEELENSWITTSIPINLSDVSNAILEFESYYYKWINEECFVVISTNNTDWPILTPEFEADSNPNVFAVWPDMEIQDPIDNPSIVQLDISEIAGNQSEVWIRFNWTGSYGYSWFIDDVRLLEQYEHDIKMEYGKVAHVNSNVHYTRIPINQFEDHLYFSSLSKNIGYDTLNNIKIALELSDLNTNPIYQDTSITYSSLISGASFSYNINNDTLNLIEGLYEATFTVTADEELDGEHFENNIIQSKFAITNDLFSIDGIGINDQSTTLPIGTNSFIDAEDGSYIMSQYTLVKDSTNFVYGIEVLLSSQSIAGGTIIGHLFYTDEILNEIVTNPLQSTEEIVLTQEDIDDGWVRLYFPTIDSLTEDSYMAAIEMYSNTNSNTISVLNDITYLQGDDASVMIIDGQLNTSPNAAAIRLLMNPENSVGIEEVEDEIQSVQTSPNPTNSISTISFTLLNEQSVYLTLMDSFGKLIYTNDLGNLQIGNHEINLDLSDFSTGIYYYSIHTEKESHSMQIVLIK